MSRTVETNSGRWEFDHHRDERGNTTVTWDFESRDGEEHVGKVIPSGEARTIARAVELEADAAEGLIGRDEEQG